MNEWRRRLAFPAFLAVAALVAMIPVVHVPLGWFETFFHESSHGLAAALTGGRPVHLVLRLDGSGVMWSAGGWRAVVAFAGYAGAITWGALIYLAATAAGPRVSSIIAATLAVLVAATTLILGSFSDPVTIAIGGVITAAFLTLWRWAEGEAVRTGLRFVGAYVMASGMRAPTYILFAGDAHNDAETLQSVLFLPQIMWVGLWLAWGVAAILFVQSRSSSPTN